MKDQHFYTTQLSAGLGLIDVTRQLLDIVLPGMTPAQLCEAALDSGQFPQMTARRLRNVVAECFSPRYMREKTVVASIKALLHLLTPAEINQLFFLYTARANPILGDFVREVYWTRYSSGRNDLELDDALNFVMNGVRERKTQKPWSTITIKRNSSYLVGCCAEYGLLTTTGRNKRTIVAYRILPKVAVYLAYDLKFKGFTDNQIVSHPDWQLFGLDHADVRDQLKRMSLQGFLIFQSASDVVHIGWNYKTMEGLVNVISKS